MSSTSLIKRQLSRIELGKCFTPSKSINISPKHQSVYGRIVFFSKTFLFCPCKIHCRWKRKEIGVEDTVRPRRTTYFCMGCRQDTAETKAFHCSRIVNMKQKCFSSISYLLSVVTSWNHTYTVVENKNEHALLVLCEARFHLQNYIR